MLSYLSTTIILCILLYLSYSCVRFKGDEWFIDKEERTRVLFHNVSLKLLSFNPNLQSNKQNKYICYFFLVQGDINPLQPSYYLPHWTRLRVTLCVPHWHVYPLRLHIDWPRTCRLSSHVVFLPTRWTLYEQTVTSITILAALWSADPSGIYHRKSGTAFQFSNWDAEF